MMYLSMCTQGRRNLQNQIQIPYPQPGNIILNLLAFASGIADNIVLFTFVVSTPYPGDNLGNNPPKIRCRRFFFFFLWPIFCLATCT